MNPVQTLLLIWAAGGVLTRDGDLLHIEAPKGAIPSQLLEVMRANKAGLLAILPARVDCQSDKEPMA
jgi:hypothetical protein